MRVFVLDQNGIPLTPTTSCRARRLLHDGVATKIWSKFNTFGIQMLIPTGSETPDAALGVDLGTKFEGYSVIVGEENVLNVKLNLPDKKKLVAKLKERREARRARRQRLRRRETRFNNRSKGGFISPSQNMLVQIRIDMIKNIYKIYPIRFIGLEDVCFNHAKHRWGKNFSTVEIGKTKIRQFIKSLAEIYEYKGYETKELREKFGYKKCSDKSKDCFESHCCDSLALACQVLTGEWVEPLDKLVIVDKTYLPTRRKIHYSQYFKGHIKKDYSRGTVKSVQKGRKVGYKGIDYILGGINKRRYTITGIINRKYRNYVSILKFISTQYIIAHSSLT